MRILLLFLLFALLPASAGTVIVQGQAGSPELEMETEARVARLKRIYPAAVVCRDRASLDSAFAALPPDGNTLYVFGHGAANARRVTLSLADGRIPAADLAGKVRWEAVYLFNSMSFAFLPFFSDRAELVASATDSERQLNPPRFPDFYLEELEADPAGDPLARLKKAGERTHRFYEEHHLARSENSMFRKGGESLSYPYGGEALTRITLAGVKPAKLPPSPPAPGRLPPTDETRRLLAEAAAATKSYAEFPAFYLHRQITLRLNPEKSALLETVETLFIREPEDCELYLPRLPQNARLIAPDGSSRELNRMPIPTPSPGSLVEVKTAIPIPPPSHLPEFQVEILLQTALPVHDTKVEIIAGDVETRQHLFNAAAIGKFPPFLTEPGGRNPGSKRARLLVTTLKNQEELLAWALRMTDRALQLDDDARDFAGKLLAGATNDREKLRRLYDYLNGLRYLTTPLGAAAFRPQPVGDLIRNGYGDCKDKATALVALARFAGIEAERVLVNRGKDVDPAFPCWQFNHMIAYIPSLDLWLDPTDGLTPFGDLPPGDHGTQGLVLDEKPLYRDIRAEAGESLLTRRIECQPDGSVTITTEATGVFDYHQRSLARRLPLAPLRDRAYRELFRELLPEAEYSGYEQQGFDAVTGKSTLILRGQAPAGFTYVALPPEIDARRDFDRRPWKLCQTLIRDGKEIPFAWENGPGKFDREAFQRLHRSWLRQIRD